MCFGERYVFAHSSELDDEVDTVLVELRKKQNKQNKTSTTKKKKAGNAVIFKTFGIKFKLV